LSDERKFISLDGLLQQFDYERLSRLRGKAHEGIIGEWIRWWLEADPYNYVYNPAPYAKNNSADILFIGLTEDQAVHIPKGVAEIENNRENWFKKLESLETYALSENYSEMDFALLCVTVYSKSKTDQQMFNELLECVKHSSEKMPNIYWVLCRLDQSPSKEEICLVFFGDKEKEPKRFISSGNCLLIKEGKTRSTHDSLLKGSPVQIRPAALGHFQ